MRVISLQVEKNRPHKEIITVDFIRRVLRNRAQPRRHTNEYSSSPPRARNASRCKWLLRFCLLIVKSDVWLAPLAYIILYLSNIVVGWKKWPREKKLQQLISHCVFWSRARFTAARITAHSPTADLHVRDVRNVRSYVLSTVYDFLFIIMNYVWLALAGLHNSLCEQYHCRLKKAASWRKS